MKWKARENELLRQVSNFQISDEEYKRLKAENQDWYIEMFYFRVLRRLNPQEIYETLGENAVMLCFEKPTEFCHRFLVAGWLELSLGVEIDELGFEDVKTVKENKERLKQALIKVMEEDEENS